MKESLTYIDSFYDDRGEKGAKNMSSLQSRSGSTTEFLVAQSVASWEETETLHLRSYLSSLPQRFEPAFHSPAHRHGTWIMVSNEGVINENPPFHLAAGGRKLPQLSL
jgi:hypothetical protein